MLDIETLGTSPGSVILTIGAVAFNFDTGQISPDPFLIYINPQSSVNAGMTLDAGTIMWWMKQSDAARQCLISDNARSLESSLTLFSTWVEKVRKDAPSQKLGIWGNDNTFDNVLIEHAYKAAKLSAPWSYWESRSVRTLVSMGTRKGFNVKRDMPFEGVKHSAVDDARHQARYCIAIQNLLDNKNT